ncbi:hypothetical protein [Paraburkholderia sediminicola]|uniref:hypothetical protein n=1 Tax=Paraburkholderia sediminicola TaxID=458836 RepID=UPI0038B849D6
MTSYVTLCFKARAGERFPAMAPSNFRPPVSLLRAFRGDSAAGPGVCEIVFKTAFKSLQLACFQQPEGLALTEDIELFFQWRKPLLS